MSEHEHEHEHDHDHSEESLEQALELDTQSQIFLEMRRQNLDLLKLSIEVAGLSGQHPPVKSGDLKSAVKNIWDLYSEFYSWIDPEEAEGDEEDEEQAAARAAASKKGKRPKRGAMGEGVLRDGSRAACSKGSGRDARKTRNSRARDGACGPIAQSAELRTFNP